MTHKKHGHNAPATSGVQATKCDAYFPTTAQHPETVHSATGRAGEMSVTNPAPDATAPTAPNGVWGRATIVR
jgi:hypothetical protein